MNKPAIAFIGLGVMGTGMARNLMKMAILSMPGPDILKSRMFRP